MKRTHRKLLPICIIMICGTTSVTAGFAAGRHVANPGTTEAKSKTAGAIFSTQRASSKTGTQSRVRLQGTSITQARRNSLRNASMIANTASRTIRSRSIDTSRKERTPVYDLPEVSRNNPRDPNGPIDGTDYRPQVIEDQAAPLPEGLNTDLLSRLKGDPRSPDGRPQGMTEEDYVHKNFESDWNARRVDSMNQMAVIKFSTDDGGMPGG